MKSKLIKAWGPYAVGTVIVDSKAEEEATAGAVRVGPPRFAALHEGGYFATAEPERQIPSEVRTSGASPLAGRPLDEDDAVGLSSRPLPASATDKGRHNDAPATPRPATSPKGQGGKAPAEEP